MMESKVHYFRQLFECLLSFGFMTVGRQSKQRELRKQFKPIKMISGNKDFQKMAILFTLLLHIVSTDPLKFNDVEVSVESVVQKYFPTENNLCVVLSDTGSEAFLPRFHVPVTVLTEDQVLQDCSSQLSEQEGYVIMTSTTCVNLEPHIVPLLKCFNQTTLKLKTKYILIIQISDYDNLNYDGKYSSLFLNLWKDFGIINIAIVPVNSDSLNKSNSPVILSYNPFLALQHSNSSAFTSNTLSQDVRAIMISRFRNMFGYRLRTVFYKFENQVNTLGDLNKKQTLGVDPTVLFKQAIESYLNTTFDSYETPDKEEFGTIRNGTATGAVGEVINGKAEYCLNVFHLKSNFIWPKTVQLLPIFFSFELIFVVPKPKQVESWRLFQYIFQRPVTLGLGLELLLLSVAALLFVKVLSTTELLHQNSHSISEVVSVWKAALSISIRRLPTSHSQRLLTACSMIFGLIFLTLFSVQLFALIKSKPRSASIRTLHELQDSNLPIYVIIKVFTSVLNSFENTTLSKLKDNFKTNDTYENSNYLDPKYLNITDRAIVYTNGLIDLIVSLPQNQKYLQYFEVVKEPIFQSLLVLYFPIGSIYFEHYSDLNFRLMSGGIFLKWYKANARFMKERTAAVSPHSDEGAHRADDNSAQCVHQSEDGRVPLTYDNLKMAFYSLYIGLTISAVCFLKEVILR